MNDADILKLMGDVKVNIHAFETAMVGKTQKERNVFEAGLRAYLLVANPPNPQQDAFAERAMEEYVADLELDVAGTEAQDLARRLMRPFLDWMVDASARNLNTKIFLVAYAHFIGWTAYMVNRSTRTDDEFINGLDNLMGLITNEAYAVTSAEERDANFVVSDLLSGIDTNSEGEVLPGHERTEVPIDPKTGKTRLDG